MEQAPEIVKVCHASLIQCLNDREVVVITSQNVNDNVTFPEHIQRKYDKGVIPIAQYSDLLRLELLTRYGGTWVDATVLCSGNVNGNLNLVEYLDAELFLYQYLGDRGTRFLGISNWFITASSNQKVLLILRDMLYEYWKDYNCVVAYFIFHIFFTMISERMPEEIEKMPRKNNKYCFYLEHKLGDSITHHGKVKRAIGHYYLFRNAQGMNPIAALFWMCVNVVMNGYKKVRYVKRYIP